MHVILLERVDKLGAIGDEVAVKDGFARNFLLPQGKALRATPANRARFERERETLEKLNAERRDAAASQAEHFSADPYMIIRQAGESGQLYGSVTSRDIADAVTSEAVRVSRAMIALDTPIKTVGLHPIKVRLHAEVAIDVMINVARTADEAARQARGEDVIQSQADEDRAFADAQAAELFEAAQEGEEAGMREDAPVGEDEADAPEADAPRDA